MFIVNSEHNSHHFLLFLLLNLNRKVFSGIASSHYNTISIQCIINFYIIDFFQIIKRCCQLYIQATQLLKNRHWNSFRVWLNNLVLLGCYSTHRDAAVIIYFVFYGQGDDALTEILSFKAKWNEQSVETKIMRMRMYRKQQDCPQIIAPRIIAPRTIAPRKLLPRKMSPR